MKTVTFELGEENYKRLIFIFTKLIKHPGDLREIGVIISNSDIIKSEEEKNGRNN